MAEPHTQFGRNGYLNSVGLFVIRIAISACYGIMVDRKIFIIEATKTKPL